MSQVDEAVLDLTISEASLLADVLGVAVPPGLVDPDDDVAEQTSGVVAPGLVERRILDGEGTVAAPVADLLTVVGCPHLVARAVHEEGGVSEIRSFAVRPEMAVEQRGLPNGLVRFTPFHPGQLVERIMAFVADGHAVVVDDLPHSEPTVSFECPVEVIEQVFSDGSTTDHHSEAERAALLVDVGVDPALALSFVVAAAGVRSTNSVTVLHRPAEQEVVGVDLTWLDAAENGLWLNDPSETNTGWRLVARLSATELAAKLASFLPFGS